MYKQTRDRARRVAINTSRTTSERHNNSMGYLRIHLFYGLDVSVGVHPATPAALLLGGSVLSPTFKLYPVHRGADAYVSEDCNNTAPISAEQSFVTAEKIISTSRVE